MNFLLLVTISCLCLAVAELLARRYRLDPSLTRRIVHVGTSLVAVAAPFFVSREELLIACLAFVVLMLFSKHRTLLTSVHNVSRHTFGEIYLPLGVFLTAYAFLPHHLTAYLFGILVLGLGDALAGFVGERRGRHSFNVFGAARSIEGSAALLCVTLALFVWLLPERLLWAAPVSILIVLAEAVTVRGTDNLVLPLLAGGVVWLFA